MVRGIEMTGSSTLKVDGHAHVSPEVRWGPSQRVAYRMGSRFAGRGRVAVYEDRVAGRDQGGN